MLISDFYPDLAVFDTTIPQPVLRRFVLSAARQLCAETNCWRHNTTGTIAPDSNRVIFDMPLPGRINLPHDVVLNGTQWLPAMNRRQQDVFIPDVRQPHLPVAYVATHDTLYVVGRVSDTDTIRAWVSLVPLNNAETLDDSFAELFFDVILLGAKAQLHLHRDAQDAERSAGRGLYDRLQQQYLASFDSVRAHFEGTRIHRAVTTSYGGY